MLIILLYGFSQAGKDTFASCFVRNHGFERFAFADSLKQYVSKKYNVPLEVLHSQEGKKQICQDLKITWRDVLLNTARDLRETDPDIFAKLCASEIHNSGSQYIVISDWRYPNEKKILEDYFSSSTFITIHIQRINQPESPVKDTSEYLLYGNHFDFKVLNNGYENLDCKAYEILEQLGLY